MREPKNKAIYFHLPESEYKKFKIFSVSAGISMQKLMRSSVNHFIKEVEEKRQESKEGR